MKFDKKGQKILDLKNEICQFIEHKRLHRLKYNKDIDVYSLKIFLSIYRTQTFASIEIKQRYRCL